MHHPAVSRFGISPICASDVRSNLTFDEKNMESKPRVFANTLSKHRDTTNEPISLLKSEERFNSLEGVVEIYEDEHIINNNKS